MHVPMHWRWIPVKPGSVHPRSHNDDLTWSLVETEALLPGVCSDMCRTLVASQTNPRYAWSEREGEGRVSDKLDYIPTS